MSVDLGSTSFRVATWQTEVQSHPSLSLPAYVSFTSAGKVLLGHEAKSIALQNPGNTFSAGTLLRCLHQHREADPDGAERPAFVTVSIKGQTKEFFVVELLALLLCRLREIVQEKVGPGFADALIICVPAIFGQVQHRAIEEAAWLAGVRRLRLLGATIGSALWRLLPSKFSPVLDSKEQREPNEPKTLGNLEERQVLLIDVGAYHTSCSMVTEENGVYEVRWVGGTACGGADIDELLCRLAIGRLARASDLEPQWPPWPSPSASVPAIWQRMLAACEKAKRSIVGGSTARVPIHLRPSADEASSPETAIVEVELTLSDLEEIVRTYVLPQLTACLSTLPEQTESWGTRYQQKIDEVLLLGGSSKIDCLRQGLLDAVAPFRSTEKKCPRASDGSQAEESGASLQGAILGDRRREGQGPLQDLMLINAYAFAIGVEAAEETPLWLQSASSAIPWIKDFAVTPLDKNEQTQICIHLREAPLAAAGQPAWLGPICVPTSQPAEADRIGLGIEVDSSGRIYLRGSDSHAVAFGLSREGALRAEELEFLSLHFRSADRWARYGQRPEPPPRTGEPLGRKGWGSSSVILRKQDLAADADESIQWDESIQCEKNVIWEDGIRDVDSGPSAAAAEEHDMPKGLKSRNGDGRGKALAERLRQKFAERQGKQNEADVLKAPSEGPKLSSTEVCAVCLCSEAELGRQFPWVLEKCGHRCLCKPCLRKMKAKNKRVPVECPLCRAVSKPVLRDRYDGNVYVAEEDP